MQLWDIGWWLWLLMGIVLLALELVTPGGLFFLFFGASAIVVGLLAAAGLAGPLWMQVLLFALLSLVSLFTLRRLLVVRLHSRNLHRPLDRLVGETAVAMEDLPVDAEGKAELRGTVWNARNAGVMPLQRGQRASVVRVEGLTVWISGDSVD